MQQQDWKSHLIKYTVGQHKSSVSPGGSINKVLLPDFDNA